MTDSQPALGPDGQLLDTSKIEWYNDPDDAHPIQPTSNLQNGHGTSSIVSRLTGTRPVWTTQSTRLAAAIAEEKLDEYGDLAQPPLPRRRPTKPCNSHRISKRKRVPVSTDVDDSDDNFSASADSEDESDSGDANIMEIDNEEVWTILIDFLSIQDINSTAQIADILPSKTMPETSNGKGAARTLKPKVKATAPGPGPPKKKARIKEIKDEDSPRNISARNGMFLSGLFNKLFSKPTFKKGTYITSYCIWFHFYQTFRMAEIWNGAQFIYFMKLS
jgi:hypothetical protein